jgi:bacillopeptidase F
MEWTRRNGRFGVMLVLLLALLAVPTQASTSGSSALAHTSAATAKWLAQAAPSATATFIVGLHDDGTQAQADQASTLANKLQRRARVHALLSARASRNDAALRAFLSGRALDSEVSAIVSFASFNGFSINASQRAIDAIRRWNQVSSVDLEQAIQLDPLLGGQQLAQINATEWNIVKIGADRVQAELGIDGTSVLVGGFDTGVRHTHSALSASYNCAGGSHTNCWKDAVNNQTTPYDDHDHGSHTMGTVLGSGGIGVAPGAKWIACKAFNSAGNGNQTDILECFDWFLAPGGSSANAPDVVNNSWGNSNGANTSYQQAVTNWVNAGIYPAFSNGNSGPSCGTVGAPASYSNAVGTGATDSNDVIASFSSRGPSPFGSITKPDLSAPGVSIRSAGGSSNSEFVIMSGTSMAGPHVTGLVALLLDANPSLTTSQLTTNMKNNALGIAASACSSSGIPNNVYGSGRIRAFESVQATLGGGGPSLPTAPSNLTATAVSSSQVNLSWIDNANNEDGFKIERCSGPNCTNFVQIATVGANVTSYQNTGLNPRTRYSYRVRAFNAAGNSGYSNTAITRTGR